MADNLSEIGEASERAAAKVRRRYQTRPPDPASLYASQGGVTFGDFFGDPQAEAASLQAGGDYNPRSVVLSSLGLAGAPAVGPAQLSTLGSGIIRRPPIFMPGPRTIETSPAAINQQVIRAKAEEIARAAQNTKGMSQRELRALYNELGLTGQTPSELVQPSLAAQQPAEEVARVTALKMADRAALDTLTPRERELFTKGKLKATRPDFILPSQEAALPAKAEFAPLKKEITRAERAFDKATAAGTAPEPVFDLSEAVLTRIPDVDQFPLPRVEAKRTEKIEPAMQGGLRRLESAAAKAGPRDWGWYNIQEPLGTFPQILGPDVGPQAARAWVDSIAGTSMVNPIDSNVRGSSYYLGKIMRGEALPRSIPLIDPVSGKTVKALAGAPPPGYGAKSQIQHSDRVREYIANLADPVSNPKPFSYRQNLGGNYGPRTVDTHDIRNAVGMPYALKAFGEEGALLPGEYTTLENLGARAAQRAGKPQAMQQGATWIGGGQYTDLASTPLPLPDILNRRVQVTAQVRGQDPWTAWVNHVTGKAPLLGFGGATVVGAGMQPEANQ